MTGVLTITTDTFDEFSVEQLKNSVQYLQKTLKTLVIRTRGWSDQLYDPLKDNSPFPTTQIRHLIIDSRAKPNPDSIVITSNLLRSCPQLRTFSARNFFPIHILCKMQF